MQIIPRVIMVSWGKSFALLITALFLTATITTSTVGLSNAAASTWNIQTIDEAAVDGGTIALDSKGNPHIVYNKRSEFYEPAEYRNRVWNVMYASWNGSSWKITTAIQNASYLDFVMGPNDNPQILYHQGLKLIYANWTGSSWLTQTVTIEGRAGSIALDSSGNPHVAYTANENPIALKYACLTGTKWDMQTVDAPGPLEYAQDYPISLAVDENNTAHIMYSTNNGASTSSSTTIKYAVGKSSNWNVKTIFEDCTLGNMVLDSNGYPNLVYFEDSQHSSGPLAYASWNGTNWNTKTFPPAPNNLDWHYKAAKLTLDSLNNPHIIYFNGTGGFMGSLMYATMRGSNWAFQTVDPNNATGLGSIMLDSNDNPHINYCAQPPNAGQPSVNGYYLNYAKVTEQTETLLNTATFLVYLLLIIAVSMVIIVFLLYIRYIRHSGLQPASTR